MTYDCILGFNCMLKRGSDFANCGYRFLHTTVGPHIYSGSSFPLFLLVGTRVLNVHCGLGAWGRHHDFYVFSVAQLTTKNMSEELV